MYCHICHQPEHGHMELCPQWKDDGQDGYMPEREPEIDEWYWGEEESWEQG